MSFVHDLKRIKENMQFIQNWYVYITFYCIFHFNVSKASLIKSYNLVCNIPCFVITQNCAFAANPFRTYEI